MLPLPVCNTFWQTTNESSISNILGFSVQARLHFHSFTLWLLKVFKQAFPCHRLALPCKRKLNWVESCSEGILPFVPLGRAGLSLLRLISIPDFRVTKPLRYFPTLQYVHVMFLSDPLPFFIEDLHKHW